MKKVSIGGSEIAVYDEGSGPPILFVHGFPLSHEMWNSQIDALRETHRCIAPDLRGFGDSDITMGIVSMEEFADDLVGLIKALGITEPVVYCGLSMGGYIAFPFLQKYGSHVRALILCNTRAQADTTEGAQNRLKLAALAMAKGPDAALEAMMPRLFAADTPTQRPDVIEQMRRMIMKTNPIGIAAGLSGMAARPDSTALLELIDVPTLVIVGTEDRITPPEDAKKMADAIPGAKFVEIEHAGHMSPMENPAAVNAALTTFLAGLD
ncbi:MAG: alpha/beta fold hydrolase [Planctomycetaceae bacterium]